MEPYGSESYHSLSPSYNKKGKKFSHIKVSYLFLGSKQTTKLSEFGQVCNSIILFSAIKGVSFNYIISERSTKKSNSGSVMHIGDVANVGSGANLFFMECFASNFFIAVGSDSAHSLSSLHKSSSSTI